MKKQSNIYIILGLGLIILTWLFVGFFRDDEFYEPRIFLKHKPSFKISFYSPIGMQDLKITDLPKDKQEDEISFQEFVIEQNQQVNNNAVGFLPFILIQFPITLLILGLYQRRKNITYKVWQPIAHYGICLIILVFGINFILSIDNKIITILTTTGIISINFLVLFGLRRVDKSNKIKASHNIRL